MVRTYHHINVSSLINRRCVDCEKLLGPFNKHLSQAFVESSAGKVFVFIPENVFEWNINSAWGGGEDPALTRNPAMDSILYTRVSSMSADTSGATFTEEPLWKKGGGGGGFRDIGQIQPQSE